VLLDYVRLFQRPHLFQVMDEGWFILVYWLLYIIYEAI